MCPYRVIIHRVAVLPERPFARHDRLATEHFYDIRVILVGVVRKRGQLRQRCGGEFFYFTKPAVTIESARKAASDGARGDYRRKQQRVEHCHNGEAVKRECQREYRAADGICYDPNAPRAEIFQNKFVYVTSVVFFRFTQ